MDDPVSSLDERFSLGGDDLACPTTDCGPPPIARFNRTAGNGKNCGQTPTSSTVVSGELKFAAGDDFYPELRRRVDQYFLTSGQSERYCPQMYVKTAVVLGWFATSYVALVFLATTWWLAMPLAISLGLSMAAIGFNIQHDGGHQAYSNRRWINKLAAMTLDLLGGSSYAWARKHNVLHHSYANITGHDDDIDFGMLARISPHQRRRWFHRFQHYYLWTLYGLVTCKWQMYDDFRDLWTGRIGGRPFVRPQGWDLVTFVGGKIVFFSLAVVIPLLLHPVWTVLLLYLMASYVQGIALSLVIQVAHCVEEAAFSLPLADTGRMESNWAVHQVEATVDYARANPFVAWFVGGLNFQIEHHLFPRICHLHYPAISHVVEDACTEFGVKYQAHATFRGAVASHFRWLKRMGTSQDAS